MQDTQNIALTKRHVGVIRRYLHILPSFGGARRPCPHLEPACSLDLRDALRNALMPVLRELLGAIATCSPEELISTSEGTQKDGSSSPKGSCHPGLISGIGVMRLHAERPDEPARRLSLRVEEDRC
jgi:hypothetical protein